MYYCWSWSWFLTWVGEVGLKGSHTFVAQSTVVENPETEEDSGLKPNGEKEAECCAEEDMGMKMKLVAQTSH